MGFLLILAIILSFSASLSVILKKRIEQVIPVAVLVVILIIYVFGLLDNLRLGVEVVLILTAVGLAFLGMTVLKFDKKNKLKELRGYILTPGLVIYIGLFALSIFINKDRILQNYDEFNHWAVIIKNMFMYNSYGTNSESIVAFNEYPPFTAVFQYLFLDINKVYSEDIILMAQNILYFSIIIPITKNIRWNKSIKKTFIILPLMVFVPLFFYENFYLDILVDAILGVMFAYTIYVAYDEKDVTFKYVQICTGIIMLALTKTSGIGLAVLALIIILIRTILNNKRNKKILKRELRMFAIITIIAAILTSIWYVKVNTAKKRWDFEQYIKSENLKPEEQKQVAKSFGMSILFNQTITERKLTVLMTITVFACIQAYTVYIMKDKNFSYYSWAMMCSIPIYLIMLLITYATIFIPMEASQLTCFERYSCTILLAYAIFQMFVLSGKEEKHFGKAFLLTITIIIILMPLSNITEKYIYAKNYKTTSKINRDIYTKFRKYTSKINKEDTVLYIMGPKANIEYQTALNNYVTMPITIDKAIVGNFSKIEELEKVAENYDYIFIYRMKEDTKEAVKTIFEEQKVKNDTLYKVIRSENTISLEKVR